MRDGYQKHYGKRLARRVHAADVISRETGAKVFSLDMAMAGDSYFDAMYRNIRAIKEAME